MTSFAEQTPQARAERRATYLTGLLWHIGTFAIINAFFWILDLVLGEAGLDWALWITGMWGLALAFHVLAYLIDGRGLHGHKMNQYLSNNWHEPQH